MQSFLVVFAAFLYITLLFVIAAFGDRYAARFDGAPVRPYVYALSIAIYCTSWTFFGSVGMASEHGLEYLAIYIGPILVFLFGYRMLARIATLSKRERITSVADFIGARYGKSFSVAALVTIIAIIGTLPYIALQLKAISGSVTMMVEHYSGTKPSFDPFVSDISLIVATLLAIFAILFGTRHADATEHQNGLVLAVAVESIVKLTAFLTVGLFVVFFMLGSPGDLAQRLAQSPEVTAALHYETSPGVWLVTIALSAFVIIMLPRQFHVMIVENRSVSELRTAAWLFPLYLVAINLFVLPIAFAGLALVGPHVESDLYVLAVPLQANQNILATIAFIGGLSAATAMVIVECVALAVMISNDLVIPIFVRRLVNSPPSDDQDWSATILNVRRISIFLILFAAFLYYRGSTGSSRLASIGLMSFAAIAQFAPAFLIGLVWRGANARGAILGMSGGILVWAYTLLLPTLAAADAPIVANGPFGIEALRPQALFGSDASALVHGVVWSLSVNLVLFLLGSLSRAASPLERIQASIFVKRGGGQTPVLRRFRSTVTVDQLRDTISRYLGVERTERAFQTYQKDVGATLAGSQAASPEIVHFSEQLLASTVGSSSARLILSLLMQRSSASARDAYRLLDDASEALQQNRGLLQTALDQMEQGITVFDKDLRLTFWNRQYRALFDLPDELAQVGVSLDAILQAQVRKGDITVAQRSAALRFFDAVQPNWRLDFRGGQYTYQIVANRMPDGGLVVTYADISSQVAADLALKQANESLEQRVRDRTSELLKVNGELAQAQVLADEANLGKTRFLAAAGHDILQPLNAARLYCAALMERTSEGPVSEAAGNIESSLDSVETILGAVLDISRLDAGAMTPSPTVFELGPLLKQVETDFQPLAASKGLELKILPSRLHVSTDRNLLRRLVQNLVSNAIKYTREGRVLVGVRRHGALLEIVVADTGIGIDQEKLSTVFQEFTRLEDGKREAQGLGLGLSIVDRLARVLHAELRVRSIKGHGSRFSVLLPIATVAAHPVASNDAVAAGTVGRLDGLRVLCIDNDPNILHGMPTLLSGWGCDTLLADSSAAALSADVDRPAIALVDYHLDNEDGLQAIAALRERWPELAAVLATADRSTELRSAAAEIGVSVIAKPVKPASLRLALTRAKQQMEAAE